MKTKHLLLLALTSIFIICQSFTVTNDDKKSTLLPGIQNYIKGIEKGFDQIPDDRKKQLKKMALYIKTQKSTNEATQLIFICTHNSRRSHLGQMWAQTAAHYYNVKNISCYSGGTEATAFNSRTVKALRKAGFEIKQIDTTKNPVYMVTYSKGISPIKGFSKKYNDAINPKDNFVAVMTCSQADKTCPSVEGSVLRVAIPYEDPKIADNTPGEEAKYDERCKQIATEMFYLFSLIKAN